MIPPTNQFLQKLSQEPIASVADSPTQKALVPRLPKALVSLVGEYAYTPDECIQSVAGNIKKLPEEFQDAAHRYAKRQQLLTLYEVSLVTDDLEQIASHFTNLKTLRIVRGTFNGVKIHNDDDASCRQRRDLALKYFQLTDTSCENKGLAAFFKERSVTVKTCEIAIGELTLRPSGPLLDQYFNGFDNADIFNSMLSSSW